MRLTLDQVIGLVRFGLTTAEAIAGHVRAGTMAVRDADNTLVPAEAVLERITRALAAAESAGAHAAERIDRRVDGTGQP